MARLDLGKQHFSLKLYKADTDRWYEAVVKDKIELRREPNVASVLTCEILRDPFITAENGDIVKLTVDYYHHQFLGQIKQTSKKTKWCSITAYDQLEVLNKSEGYYAYEDKTAAEIVNYIVKANNMAMVDPPRVFDPGYKIQARVEETTWLDMIHNAIEITKENTGVDYYIWDDAGNICFTDAEWMANEQNYLRVEGGISQDYTYVEDASDIVTQVTAIEEVTKEGEDNSERKLTVVVNEGLEKKYGTINKNVKIGEGENPQVVAATTLSNLEKDSKTITLNGVQGSMTVRGGTPIKVDLFSLDSVEYIRGWFRVDSVTHIFQDGYHSMDLNCTLMKMLDDWTIREPDWTYPFPTKKEEQPEEEQPDESTGE